MNASGYRYLTYFGFYAERERDGGRWLVYAPTGEVVAQARDWWMAMTFALQQRARRKAEGT